MLNKNFKNKIGWKLFALFTVVRGYNILMLILAMYFTAYFIFSSDTTLFDFVKSNKIHLIILASALTVAAGYIINNFYDAQKDRLGRPVMAYISRFVSQEFKLNVYLLLNFLALLTALIASWRVALFFVVYQVLVWFYSHKLSKIVFLNNIFHTILSLFPFLALLLYYNNHAPVIFLHGFFLGGLLLIADLSKDLLTQKADLIYNYKTLVTVFGTQTSKIVISIFIMIIISLGIFMQNIEKLGHMRLYFLLMTVALFFLSIIIWFIHSKVEYLFYQYAIKTLLGIGVISIAWIKINPLDLQKFFIIN